MAVRVRVGVDTRERALLESLDDLLDGVDAAALHGMELTPCTLDMGDILVEALSPAGQPEEAVQKAWVFERKTVPDLVASIHDGRYREQKARLSAHYPRECITYIVEGLPCVSTWCSLQPNPRMSHSHQASIQGAIFNTLFRDGMHVIWTKDPEDTAAFILAFAMRLAKKPDVFLEAGATAGSVGVGAGGTAGTTAGTSYAHAMVLKSRPKGNITPDLCWRLMLSQIPDISIKLAESIASKWPSMQAFFEALGPLSETERRAALTAIPKLGAKKAAAILSNVFTCACA